MKVLNLGFTLIELLLVITIIGILAGISIPRMDPGNEKADLSMIKSDLRNIQINLEITAMNNRNKYPNQDSFSEIDLSNISSYKYVVNPEYTVYLVYYSRKFQGRYYYIKSNENEIRYKKDKPSL